MRQTAGVRVHHVRAGVQVGDHQRFPAQPGCGLPTLQQPDRPADRAAPVRIGFDRREDRIARGGDRVEPEAAVEALGEGQPVVRDTGGVHSVPAIAGQLMEGSRDADRVDDRARLRPAVGAAEPVEGGVIERASLARVCLVERGRDVCRLCVAGRDRPVGEVTAAASTACSWAWCATTSSVLTVCVSSTTRSARSERPLRRAVGTRAFKESSTHHTSLETAHPSITSVAVPDGAPPYVGTMRAHG